MAKLLTQQLNALTEQNTTILTEDWVWQPKFNNGCSENIHITISFSDKNKLTLRGFFNSIVGSQQCMGCSAALKLLGTKNNAHIYCDLKVDTSVGVRNRSQTFSFMSDPRWASRPHGEPDLLKLISPFNIKCNQNTQCLIPQRSNGTNVFNLMIIYLMGLK